LAKVNIDVDFSRFLRLILAVFTTKMYVDVENSRYFGLTNG